MMRGQRGVALITAMLVVALAATAAVHSVARQQLEIRRTGNLLDGDQAWLYAHGIEEWAGHILRRDREEGARDHLGEDWARTLPAMPVEGGQLTGSLEDLQGRFNLNNLLDAEGKPSTLWLQRFRRLLAYLQLDPDLAVAVLDWMDRDIEPRFPRGAEDDTYLNRQPPYRTANRPLASPTELRLISGIDEQAYQTLRPHLTALPGPTAINLNTATPAVMASLADGLTTAEVEQLIAERGDEGYPDVNTCLRAEALAGIDVPEEGLDVGSGYFRLHAAIELGRTQLRLSSILARDANGRTRILTRAKGND